LKLYKLWRNIDKKRSTYDQTRGVVVAAADQDAAKRVATLSCGCECEAEFDQKFVWETNERLAHDNCYWLTSPEVVVEIIGEAAPGIQPGILLHDFHHA
jgi:hypothetical protein